eukprot:CAMPEP_0184007668 /NCGR_PEP_ID=MMETSP0954-20121128/1477_1 /TAXON_ID=627963 /ORGANISM="Aplanochytrium sp, Strain PBS07" /LENGTH=294 /DNA_ID=CAMNT_0026286555 /DNA_START=195 /DNA_END=1079 /DNA_ORIENTATION=-
MTHGYGSGLGFYFSNFDDILSIPNVGRVLAVDWLGMGGSDRPNTCFSPVRVPLLFNCNSRFSTSDAVDFFIDRLEMWREYHQLDSFVLIGHSLGGYLSARYAMKYGDRVETLILASPVGFPEPEKFTTANRNGENPAQALQLIDALWRKNATPQSIVRMLGPRGLKTVSSVVKRRFQNRWSESDNDLIASYLYHISVAKASGEYALNSLLMPVMGPNPGVYAREPLINDFDKIKANRVRILFGDNDWLRGNYDAANSAIRENSINGDVVIIPRAGHHLYIDNAPAFHQAVREVI